jgi:hypothetical protein
MVALLVSAGVGAGTFSLGSFLAVDVLGLGAFRHRVIAFAAGRSHVGHAGTWL